MNHIPSHSAILRLDLLTKLLVHIPFALLSLSQVSLTLMLGIGREVHHVSWQEWPDRFQIAKGEKHRKTHHFFWDTWPFFSISIPHHHLLKTVDEGNIAWNYIVVMAAGQRYITVINQPRGKGRLCHGERTWLDDLDIWLKWYTWTKTYMK